LNNLPVFLWDAQDSPSWMFTLWAGGRTGDFCRVAAKLLRLLADGGLNRMNKHPGNNKNKKFSIVSDNFE